MDWNTYSRPYSYYADTGQSSQPYSLESDWQPDSSQNYNYGNYHPQYNVSSNPDNYTTFRPYNPATSSGPVPPQPPTSQSYPSSTFYAPSHGNQYRPPFNPYDQAASSQGPSWYRNPESYNYPASISSTGRRTPPEDRPPLLQDYRYTLPPLERSQSAPAPQTNKKSQPWIGVCKCSTNPHGPDRSKAARHWQYSCPYNPNKPRPRCEYCGKSFSGREDNRRRHMLAGTCRNKKKRTADTTSTSDQ